MRGIKRKSFLIILFVLFAALAVTACSKKGKKKRSKSKEQTPVAEQSQTPSDEEQSQSSEIEDDSAMEAFEDGSMASEAWKNGIIKINGQIYNLSKTTPEKISSSGYQADEESMNYIIGAVPNQDITMSDQIHQSIRFKCYNFSKEKMLYVKHAVIIGYDINLYIDDGLQATDAVFPGNIKAGMTKEDIIKIVGEPDNSSDYSISYTYKENDSTCYYLNFTFDSSVVKKVSYENRKECVNVADDSEEINRLLDNTTETSKLDKDMPSDQLEDAEIKIRGSVYKMPINMQDLIALEYGAANADGENINAVLNPKQSSDTAINRLSNKNRNLLYAETVENHSDKPCALSHCWVSELVFNSDAEEIVVAKGIKVGSSYDDVVKAFGTTVQSDSDGLSYFSMKYEFKNDKGAVEVYFIIDKETKQVRQINICVKQL